MPEMLCSLQQNLYIININYFIIFFTAQCLKCCVAYNKPCGCIRRYTISGSTWKENNLPSYGNMQFTQPELVLSY